MAVIKIVPMPGAVGDKGDEGAVGPRGQQGETGLQGPAGADALWSYNGEYNPGAGYAVGDVVTFDGQLWYRKNSNGGNVGDTPSEGLFWDLLAAKGADGENGSDALWNYRGHWQPNTSYSEGDIVTINGSCWYANKTTSINPPGDSNDFDIIALRGTDSIAPTSGTWDTKFAELSGIDVSVTNPGYEANKMGYYYCVGDLVHWEFRMLMNNPVSWGQTGIDAKTFKFALPFVPYYLNENESESLALRNAFSRTVANGWFRVVANSNPVPDTMLPPSAENLYYEADESHLIFANAIIRPQVYDPLTGNLRNTVVGQSYLDPWTEGTQLLGVAYLYADSPEGPVTSPGFEANTNTIGYQSISAQWPANLIQAQLDQSNSPNPLVNQTTLQFNFSGVYRKA